MKNRKNIAIMCCLLWVVLLCFSGVLKAKQLWQDAPSYSQDFPEELLPGKGPCIPVAWSEPTTPHHVFTPAAPLLPLPVIAYRISLHLLPYAGPKPIKAVLRFSSLAEQFRILPNAP